CRANSRTSVPSFTNKPRRAKVQVHKPVRNLAPRRNHVPAPNRKAKVRDVTAMWSMLSSKSSTKTRRSNQKICRWHRKVSGSLAQPKQQKPNKELINLWQE